MAYDRYAVELTDKDGQIYGVMDAEAREEVGELNSAINDMTLSERLLILMLNEEYSLDIPVPVDPSENISITWSGTTATVENLNNTTISWNGTIATIGG